MKGKILEFSIDANTGVISGEDGNRYSFNGGEVKADRPPRPGDEVDFQAAGEEAQGVYISAGAVPADSKSKIVAGLLALFLGGLGIHKFYLGYTGPGIILIVCYIGGFLLLGIPSIIVGIICLIEAIIYLTKTDQEFHDRYVANRKAWF